MSGLRFLCISCLKRKTKSHFKESLNLPCDDCCKSLREIPMNELEKIIKTISPQYAAKLMERLKK